jgi:thiosulfate/3-mercaptopyruvate sulfurtransferase
MLTDPLVTIDWLKANLDAVKVIDGTWSMPNDASDLPSGYIPNSSIFDLDIIANLDSDLSHMLPSADVFAEAIGAMGITMDDTVVVYDRHGVFSSPRVWWTFKMFGHKAVYVLDGGLPAWIAAGHEVEAALAETTKSFYKISPACTKVATIDDVLRAVKTDTQIVDARPAGRFKGHSPEPRENLASGHMPGAINVPFGMLRTPSSHFRPLSEIAQMFQDVDLTAPIITTCGSGITAAGLAFNLARLGADDVSVYDGSWAEYGARQDVPVVKG